jgi:hypothetical protein
MIDDWRLPVYSMNGCTYVKDAKEGKALTSLTDHELAKLEAYGL